LVILIKREQTSLKKLLK